jgi:hypothetical protein
MKAGLLAEIRALGAEHEVTLLLVSHDSIDAVTICFPR